MRTNICCIQSRSEIASAIRERVHALGLVSAMPSGRGITSLAPIRDFVRPVPRPMAPDEVAATWDRLPGSALFETVHVAGEAEISTALRPDGALDPTLLREFVRSAIAAARWSAPLS